MTAPMKSDARKSRWALPAALVYTVFTGTASTGIKIGVRYAPPLTLLTVRFLVAGGIMALLARWSGAVWPRDARAWARLAMLGLLNMGLPATFNFIGLRYASATAASIVLVSHPVLLALLGPRLLGEKLTARKAVGLVFGAGGVVYVMLARLGAGRRADSPLGIALMFAAVSSMVVAAIVFKRFPPRESVFVVNVAQQLASGVLLVPFVLMLEDPTAVRITPALGAAVFQLVFVVSIGAGVLWFWLLRVGEASTASSALFFAPGCGVLSAALFLHERFGVREMVGLAAVTVGVLLINFPKRSAKRANPASSAATPASAGSAAASSDPERSAPAGGAAAPNRRAP
jgi:drug/metabolite transporter (DMT)-like permease